MDSSLQLVHSEHRLTLFTLRETTANTRTFDIESTTPTRRRSQSFFLNSDTIGSMGCSRTPQGRLPESPQPVAAKIRIDPKTLIQVQFEPRLAEEIVSGHVFVTLCSTRTCHHVTPSPSLSRTTALFMSCSLSPPNLILDGQFVQANVGVLRPDLAESRSEASILIQQTNRTKSLAGQTR